MVESLELANNASKSNNLDLPIEEWETDETNDEIEEGASVDDNRIQTNKEKESKQLEDELNHVSAMIVEIALANMVKWEITEMKYPHVQQ